MEDIIGLGWTRTMKPGALEFSKIIKKNQLPNNFTHKSARFFAPWKTQRRRDARDEVSDLRQLTSRVVLAVAAPRSYGW